VRLASHGRTAISFRYELTLPGRETAPIVNAQIRGENGAERLLAC
jgi:hypothetical protein